MPATELTHVFFDIGGVLGTNGWDREQRARAVAEFGLDDEFEERHQEIAGQLETGAIDLEEYLDIAVFHRPCRFSREAFCEFILAQSQPYPEVIALARRVAEAGRVRLMTLNNESEALNLHRIGHFGLRSHFDAYLSSCWLRLQKPSLAFFQRALAIAQADPRRSLFIDDREQNLAPARRLGMQVVLFTDAAALEATLADAGTL